MEVKYKKKKEDSIIDRYSVPVSSEMKVKLHQIKETTDIDVNGTLRDCIKKIISEFETNPQKVG